MEFATYSDIEIVGLQGMQKVIKLEILEQLNEHGRALISVYIEPRYGREQFCKDNVGNDVQINVQQKTIFCGYITEMKDVDRDGLHIYEIELSSYSRKLDYREKSRSYQKVDTSYKGVAEQIMKDYDSAFVVWENSGESAIGSPIFQYMETDWKFIKRLASMQGQSVITNVYVAQPYLMIDKSYYQHEMNKDYRHLEHGLSEDGLYKYHRVECTKDYQMGTTLSINEGIFRIIQKHTQLVDAQLIFVYCLAGAEAMEQKEICNTSLAGLQLAGSVSEVMEDKIKVQLDIDKEWADTGEYYFDWKPISSNIMYAMPEKSERVHVRLADVRGQKVSVINCLRKNGDTCPGTSDVDCKIMQYGNKKMELTTDRIGFESFTEKELQVALRAIDVEGIFAQVQSQMTLVMQKGLKVYSKTGKVTITTPFQIVLRDSLGDSDAELAINQTIECQGDVVQVQADARIDYPAINDAPVEIKNGGVEKLLRKVLTAVAVVAVVAATAALVAAVTVATGGAALAVIGAAAAKAATAVVVGALIGGGVFAGIGFGVQVYSDIRNGIKRDWSDYLYQGVDNFCTGAIVTAPMATPWGLPFQLLGVGVCSFTYQMTDNALDEEFGGDFYDEDTNMVLTMIFDVAFAGLGSGITKGLNKLVGKITHMPKYMYKSIAKFLNKCPFIKNKYPIDQANINSVLKVAFREPLKKVQKFLNQKWVTYLVLGGKEGMPGADIPTSLVTDSDVNFVLGWLVNMVENGIMGSEYTEDYNDYSRVVLYEDNDARIIDFDENGDLVFE